MKVKIFEEPYLNTSPGAPRQKSLEEQINDFLANTPGLIVYHTFQSSASSGESEDFSPKTIISIWYEEGK